MRTPEEVKRDFVRQWLEKAHKDLRAAEVLLKEELDEYDSVGFHAQQAAEKFMKAFLVHHQVEFPKTHDIVALRKLIAGIDRVLADSLAPADALTPYGVEFRYPGDLPPVSRDLAEQTVRLSAQARDAVLSRLKYST